MSYQVQILTAQFINIYMCGQVLMIRLCSILYLIIILIWYLPFYRWASHCVWC